MCNLESEVHRLESDGFSMLHVDILDGHFSPSMPLGLETVRQLRRKTKLEFDCHVMTSSPEYFIDELLSIGIQQLTFQIETCDHVDEVLNLIRSKNVKAGVALKPATPLNVLDYVIDKCDVVLLMLINPGYASSKTEGQVSYAGQKIKDLRKLISGRQLNTKIEVDGRITKENVCMWKDIVDIFVTGSSYKDA